MKSFNVFQFIFLIFLIIGISFSDGGKIIVKRQSGLEDTPPVNLDNRDSGSEVESIPVIPPNTGNTRTDFWSDLSNFFSNVANSGQRFFGSVFGGGSSSFGNLPEGSGTGTGNEWTSSMSREMRQIFDSVSRMWQQTIDSLSKWGSSLQSGDNSLWNRLANGLRDVEKEISNLWDANVKFITINNRTLNPTDAAYTNGQTELEKLRGYFTEHTQRVNDMMTNFWQQLNGQKSGEISKFLPTFNSTQIDQYLLDLQSMANSAWQQLADTMKTTQSQIEKSEVPESINGAVEGLKRMQRNVDSMWQSMKNGETEVDPNDPNSATPVEGRITTVFNGLKNFYNERGNGSTIRGVFQSAHDRAQRVGDYFKNAWNSGTDFVRNGQKEVENRRVRVEDMLSSLSQEFTSIVNTLGGRSKDIDHLFEEGSKERESKERESLAVPSAS